MQEASVSDPNLSEQDVALDVKPLRTLSPMFPAAYGYTTYYPCSTGVPFISVVPNPGTYGTEPGEHPSSLPAFPGFATTGVSNQHTSGSQVEATNPTIFSPVFPYHNIPGAANQCAPAHLPKPVTNGAIHMKNASVDNGTTSATAATPVSSFSVQPLAAVPINSSEAITPANSLHTSTSGRKLKTPSHLIHYNVSGSDTEGSDRKSVHKRAKKAANAEPILLPITLSEEPRENVEEILMIFDALRKRLLQVDEIEFAKQRSDLKASAIMMSNEIRANLGKRIGSVPGIEVGDIFYFRIELCIVGLHAPSMGGIDYISAKFGNDNEPIAISVVSAGGYENEDEDVDMLIYTGSGGNSKVKPADDQKLERGNLALDRSFNRGNQIRVVRSVKDGNVVGGKIYIYDGLYRICEAWKEKGKTGFNVFKYKLLREPGQPDGIALWKMTEKWSQNPSSRGHIILPDISSGAENIPVCLLNEIDEEKGPSHFQYVCNITYFRPISSVQPLQGCRCLTVCLPGDINCSCSIQNGGELPYGSSGLLVSRKAMVYECGDFCQCSVNCRNRVTQKGVKHHFEIFKTRERGWGLRSWDAIRAGTFICEYTGEVVNKIEPDESNENDYIFQATYVGEKILKWNYIPQLLGEPSVDTSTNAFQPLPIIINAKNMGNISRFMNHSCSPNVFWQPVQHDHSDEGLPHIMLFALKHIPPLTELTFDYGLRGTRSDISSDGEFHRPKKCLCGSHNCRGYFG